ncbi:MAG: hypothetical protein H7837_13490 [Magnetococcus sp. MYC-9]
MNKSAVRVTVLVAVLSMTGTALAGSETPAAGSPGHPVNTVADGKEQKATTGQQGKPNLPVTAKSDAKGSAPAPAAADPKDLKK